MTMTHGEMLVKLYEETLKQLKMAQNAIERNDIVAANSAMQKAQRILSYLKETLDFKYEISNNLASLYNFFTEQIVSANVHKDSNLLAQIIPLIEDLKDTFVQGERLARMGSRVGASVESRVG